MCVPDEGYSRDVPDEGYSRDVPDEVYSRDVPDEGYSRDVPDEGYSRNVPDEGYSRNVLCALNLISTFLLLQIIFYIATNIFGQIMSCVCCLSSVCRHNGVYAITLLLVD